MAALAGSGGSSFGLFLSFEFNFLAVSSPLLLSVVWIWEGYSLIFFMIALFANELEVFAPYDLGRGVFTDGVEWAFGFCLLKKSIR